MNMYRAPGSKDKSPLLYFYGVDCTHCDLMDPLMKQLTEETGMGLRKFEVWYNDDNLRLLQRLDKVRYPTYTAAYRYKVLTVSACTGWRMQRSSLLLLEAFARLDMRYVPKFDSHCDVLRILTDYFMPCRCYNLP